MRKFKTNFRDGVFAIGEILFCLFLLPSLFGPNKPDVVTSVGTAAILTTFAVVQSTYKNWYAAGLLVFTSALWIILAIQEVM